MNNSKSSRRKFLRNTGLALAATAAPKMTLANEIKLPDTTSYKYPNPGKIVIVYHPNAVIGYNNADYNVVQQMFDQAIMQFTGITSSPADALASLFPGLTASKKIALKPNFLNSSVPTRKELAKAVITRLVQMLGGFPAANITFYERHSFSGVGYTTSYFGQPVNLVYDVTFPNLGYTIYCNGRNRPYSKSLHDADYLINMSVLKDHDCGSDFNFTLSFKNHLGTVNPAGSLGIHCDKKASLDIMADNILTTKQRIVITDCLFAIYNGGPSGAPQAMPKKIMISQDPVTSDYQGRKMINELRLANGLSAKAGSYIEEASKPPYEIGVADPNQMNVISINMPVELRTFMATLADTTVTLKWTTEHETNNSGFEIQRSIDGYAEWENAGFVIGGGTTTKQSEYRFVDTITAALKNLPTIYYRLKQIDFDGTYKYSFVVNVRPVQAGTSWRIEQNYPNPFNADTEIPLQIDKGINLHVDVIDTTGTVVTVLHDSFINPGLHYLIWDGSTYATGIYTCRATADGLTREIRMILMK